MPLARRAPSPSRLILPSLTRPNRRQPRRASSRGGHSSQLPPHRAAPSVYLRVLPFSACHAPSSGRIRCEGVVTTRCGRVAVLQDLLSRAGAHKIGRLSVRGDPSRLRLISRLVPDATGHHIDSDFSCQLPYRLSRPGNNTFRDPVVRP